MTTEKTLTRREIAALAAGAAGVAVLATPAQASQPNMQKALDHLRTAYSFLDKAAANKGGHRRKAMEYTSAAISQVQAGIKFAS